MQALRFEGVVQSGMGEGSKMSAPTLNFDIRLARQGGFTKGLYVCRAVVSNQAYQGLLYYGVNSLSQVDCLEVYLFEYNGNAYGQTVAVEAGKYIRSEIVFSSKEALQAQIALDIIQAREFLKTS